MKKIIFIHFFLFSIALCSKAQTQSSSFTSIGSNNVKFFPNPAVSVIQFDFSDNIDLRNSTFKIYSFIGKKIFETNQLRQSTVVNLNDFSRGVYIFQLIDRNGKILESSKFVVQK